MLIGSGAANNSWLCLHSAVSDGGGGGTVPGTCGDVYFCIKRDGGETCAGRFVWNTPPVPRIRITDGVKQGDSSFEDSVMVSI